MSERFMTAIQSAVDKFNAGDVDGYLAPFAVYELDDIGRVTASWAFGDPGALFRQLDGNEVVTS